MFCAKQLVCFMTILLFIWLVLPNSFLTYWKIEGGDGIASDFESLGICSVGRKISNNSFLIEALRGKAFGMPNAARHRKIKSRFSDLYCIPGEGIFLKTFLNIDPSRKNLGEIEQALRNRFLFKYVYQQLTSIKNKAVQGKLMASLAENHGVEVVWSGSMEPDLDFKHSFVEIKHYSTKLIPVRLIFTFYLLFLWLAYNFLKKV